MTKSGLRTVEGEAIAIRLMSLHYLEDFIQQETPTDQNGPSLLPGLRAYRSWLHVQPAQLILVLACPFEEFRRKKQS